MLDRIPNEKFLHHIWKYRLFDTTNLVTTSGDKLVIEKSGVLNSHAGPDFFTGKVRVDTTLWVGNIEIHTRSSDWNRHGHQNDAAYENVILHVVYVDDQSVRRKSGELIPTIELKNRISANLINKYEILTGNTDRLSCASKLPKVSPFIKANWLDRMVAQRFDRKLQALSVALIKSPRDWHAAFYLVLARAFGFKVNSDPFELLAKSLPLKILLKHQDNLLQVEALLFGQAGLIPKNPEGHYEKRLKQEYILLQKKYGLKALDSTQWKFLRMRPANFPTIRLAQFAALIHTHGNPFQIIVKENITVLHLHQMLRCEVSIYWQTHYVFCSASAKKMKPLGKRSIDLILINAVVPMLHKFEKETGLAESANKSLLLLEQIKAEKNIYTDTWISAGEKVANAYSSQAVIELMSGFCNEKKCLNCSIGNEIMKINE